MQHLSHNALWHARFVRVCLATYSGRAVVMRVWVLAGPSPERKKERSTPVARRVFRGHELGYFISYRGGPLTCLLAWGPWEPCVCSGCGSLDNTAAALSMIAATAWLLAALASAAAADEAARTDALLRRRKVSPCDMLPTRLALQGPTAQAPPQQRRRGLANASRSGSSARNPSCPQNLNLLGGQH